MSRIAAVLVLILTPCLASAAPKAAAAKTAGETVLGKGVKTAAAVAIDELLASPDRYVGQTVRVAGKVVDVCSHRGCWMQLGNDKGQLVRVKVRDGDIVFPVSARGRPAEAEGVFAKTELSPDDALARAKHLAEEAGKPFDPATAKAETVVYQINGTGAVIR